MSSIVSYALEKLSSLMLSIAHWLRMQTHKTALPANSKSRVLHVFNLNYWSLMSNFAINSHKNCSSMDTAYHARCLNILEFIWALNYIASCFDYSNKPNSLAAVITVKLYLQTLTNNQIQTLSTLKLWHFNNSSNFHNLININNFSNSLSSNISHNYNQLPLKQNHPFWILHHH